MLQNGQTTIDGSRTAPKATTDTLDLEDRQPDEQLQGIEPNANGHEPPDTPSTSPQTNGDGNAVFQHYEPNGGSLSEEPKDVEMG